MYIHTIQNKEEVGSAICPMACGVDQLQILCTNSFTNYERLINYDAIHSFILL